MIQYLSKTNLKRWEGKICVVRADLDINPGEEHVSPRIPAMLKTIQLLLKHNIKVVLIGHRGRPKEVPIRGEGRQNPAERGITNSKRFSLKPFVSLLSKKTRRNVVFIPRLVLSSAKKTIQNSTAKIFLLENIRFLKGERENSPSLARKLASLGDFFVNNSFANSHRKHASMSAITRFMPSYAGVHLEYEMKHLTHAMKHFKHPLTIILGGAKISERLGMLKYFWKRADYFLLGGGAANTFLAARGLPIGDSIFETSIVPLIKKYIDSDKIKLPTDLKIKNRQILDIGPCTADEYSEIIARSKTIIWSGPLGLFEKKEFAHGSRSIAKAIAKSKAFSVAGGGETASLVITMRLAKKFSFVSTGGGAMLEFLSGKKLPGIEALK